MNIFYLDHSPEKSAHYMADIHVQSKMIVESGQILANCYSLEALKSAPKTQKETVRKHSYVKHPCVLWARDNEANFRWLVAHALFLADERMYRWPDRESHFTESFIYWCTKNAPDNLIASHNELTVPALAFGDYRYLRGPDPVESYRNYYKIAKGETLKMTWTKRKEPGWWFT